MRIEVPGLSECSGRVRTSKQLLQEFGLCGHPAVAEAMTASQSYRVSQKIVSDVLCHMDTHTMFMKHDEAALPLPFLDVLESDDDDLQLEAAGEPNLAEEGHLQAHRDGLLHMLLLHYAPEFLKVSQEKPASSPQTPPVSPTPSPQQITYQ